MRLNIPKGQDLGRDQGSVFVMKDSSTGRPHVDIREAIIVRESTRAIPSFDHQKGVQEDRYLRSMLSNDCRSRPRVMTRMMVSRVRVFVGL
jgi:hypothetical protein